MPRPQRLGWGARLGNELNTTSGYVGAGGVIGTAASFLATGQAASALLLLGAVVGFGGLGVALIRSTFTKRISVEKKRGVSFPLKDLWQLSPPVPAIGVIGNQRSGKTTFREDVAQSPRSHTRTQVLTAFLKPLTNCKYKYMAILDGSGDWDAQQYEILESSDFLIIFLDHSSSDSSSQVDDDRLNAHSRFLTQIIYRLQNADSNVKTIFLLMNKRDLWENSSDANKVQTFVSSQYANLRMAIPGKTIILRNYSNENSSDLTGLLVDLQSQIDLHFLT